MLVRLFLIPWLYGGVAVLLVRSVIISAVNIPSLQWSIMTRDTPDFSCRCIVARRAFGLDGVKISQDVKLDCPAF